MIKGRILCQRRRPYLLAKKNNEANKDKKLHKKISKLKVLGTIKKYANCMQIKKGLCWFINITLSFSVWELLGSNQ